MRKFEDHTVRAGLLSAALASSDAGAGLESEVAFGLMSCRFRRKNQGSRWH